MSRCLECGSTRRAIANDLCTVCRGVEVHSFDAVQREVRQRNVPRYIRMIGYYDSMKQETRTPGQGGHETDAWHAERAKKRRAWGGR